MLMIVLTKMKDVTVGVLVQDLEVGLKISTFLYFKITEKVLIVIGGVDIGLKPAPVPTIIQVVLVDNWGFIVMVMT